MIANLKIKMTRQEDHKHNIFSQPQKHHELVNFWLTPFTGLEY